MDRRDFLKSAAVGAAGVLLTGKAVAAEKAVTAGRSDILLMTADNALLPFNAGKTAAAHSGRGQSHRARSFRTI